MSILRSVPMGAVFLLWTSWLCAAPSVEPVVAPLRAAVQSVWKASPAIAAARAERDAAGAQARAAARPVYNPELQLGAENADVDRRTVGVGLTLDLSGKRRARAAQGDAQAQAGDAAYAVARRDIAARWLKAWVGAAQSQRQLALGGERVELMRRFDALAAERLRVGDIGRTERDLATLALGEAQMQQAQLASQAAGARAALVSLVPAPVAAPSLPDEPPPAAESIAPLAADALPELAQARAERDAASAGVRVARRARMPDPTVSLVGGEVRSGLRRDRVLGVNVSIPLPVLNTGSAEVAAALAMENAAGARMRERELAQRAALEETRARYAALREAVGAFRAGRADAFAERTALLEKLWRAGELGTGDYLMQLKQSLDTALAGRDLQAQAWQAWFDYLAAAGRLTDWLDGRSPGAAP